MIILDSANLSGRFGPLPLAVFAFITSTKGHSASAITGDSTLLIAFAAIVYFLASIARSKGASLQEKLIGKWGGWPTTIILRHSDNTIDVGTKARYHLRLSSLPGAPVLPSEEEERAVSRRGRSEIPIGYHALD